VRAVPPPGAAVPFGVGVGPWIAASDAGVKAADLLRVRPALPGGRLPATTRSLGRISGGAGGAGTVVAEPWSISDGVVPLACPGTLCMRLVGLAPLGPADLVSPSGPVDAVEPEMVAAGLAPDVWPALAGAGDPESEAPLAVGAPVPMVTPIAATVAAMTATLMNRPRALRKGGRIFMLSVPRRVGSGL
jgi:hypothetical protein